MRQRTKGSSSRSTPPDSGEANPHTNVNTGVVARRSAYVILTLFVLVVYGSWGVYHYQFQSLPEPLSAERVGKRGFSEHEAMNHVKALTQSGPHPVGSDALDRALQYVMNASKAIKQTAHWEVEVEIDLFHTKSGANRLAGGHFKGKTLVYADLSHIVLRILPKFASEAAENAILVSSHIDTVFSTEGAGDCSSCVAVMLELARGVSQWAHGFKHAVIFLFNTGEEEGLNGAHSFITQHPWSDTVRVAIDLEAMGIGGMSSIFQAGPDPWTIENFVLVAKYPSGQIAAQDIFTSGAIKSATDFQVYKEIAGLSGLDFAYMDNSAVYHTKNDKLKLLKPGSLQHLGENMLAFLQRVAVSSHLPKGSRIVSDGKSSQETAVYFDILGSYMILFRQKFASMFYNSVIVQSLLIWGTSLLMGGYTSATSLALSSFGVILMWVFSVSFSVLVAFVLPLISSCPVPFVSSPWLVVGLFAAPALLGAFTGQHIGYLIIRKYLSHTIWRKRGDLSSVIQDDLAKLDAERWLFKGGLLQWLILLVMGNYYKIGSSYLALVWLVSPAFSYGLLEATLSPGRLPKPLKTLTLLIGLFVPFLISSGLIVRLTTTIIGIIVRLERDPGKSPEWLGNVILAVFVAAMICLTLVYLLSYVHISGAKMMIVAASLILLALSLGAVLSGVVPPFTEDTARAVNVVHVVDATGSYGKKAEPTSHITLFSTTPGNLIKEVEHIGEEFHCGRDKPLDLVTFSAKYHCSTNKDAEIGWTTSDVPEFHVTGDTKGNKRTTHISFDTKLSTRWSLGINTAEIEDFQLEGMASDSEDENEELIPVGDKSSVDGWHIIQFSGGRQAPTKFNLTLVWAENHTQPKPEEGEKSILLKLRTDVDKLTPRAEHVINKLPPWCSLFGKSTSPHTLAFLSSLPVAL